MKKITMFYLEDCPYCIKAARAIEELLAENPAYAKLEIERIDESKNAALADEYDYYAVPSLFFGKEKQYEANIWQKYEDIRDNFRRVFDLALED